MMMANVGTERIRLCVQLPLRSAVLSALSTSCNEHRNNKGTTSLTLKSYELLSIEQCCTPSFPPGHLKRRFGVITISSLQEKLNHERHKPTPDTLCCPSPQQHFNQEHDLFRAHCELLRKQISNATSECKYKLSRMFTNI